VTFDAGQTTKTISVLVNGAGEPNETFLVNLGQAVPVGSAVIADGQGVGTIVADEPRVNINSVSKNEGNSGTTQFVFTVSLSPASNAAVSLNFATANGSAKSVDDYDARAGVLAFNAGETSKTVAVTVKGDGDLSELRVSTSGWRQSSQPAAPEPRAAQAHDDVWTAPHESPDQP
jgi:hypothetical protein